MSFSKTNHAKTPRISRKNGGCGDFTTKNDQELICDPKARKNALKRL
nr:MAG TPA: hypothetical protein [Caudoviricetes sp.]